MSLMKPPESNLSSVEFSEKSYVLTDLKLSDRLTADELDSAARHESEGQVLRPALAIAALA
jgi:hypothetical protein